jgi:branched-chain amino acid transport system substrate-binding protein
MLIHAYRNICVSSLPILLVFGVSCVGASEIAKIGHAAPLTGGSAHLGKDTENGARLAIEEINSKGLVIGGQRSSWSLILKTTHPIRDKRLRSRKDSWTIK